MIRTYEAGLAARAGTTLAVTAMGTWHGDVPVTKVLIFVVFILAFGFLAGIASWIAGDG